MPDNKLRFGAKSPDGRCSMPWIAIRRKSDVYLGVRWLTGKLKLSLHQDGWAHIALDNRFYPQLCNDGLPAPPSRCFTRWRMPDLPDKGVAHVASIVFPSPFLRHRPSLRLTKPMFWELAPQQGALEVGLFYGRRLATFAPPARLRFWTRLSDGRVVMVAVRSTDFDDQVLDPLRRPHKTYPLSAEFWNSPPGEAIEDCSALLWSDVKDGQAVVIWEISGVSISRN